MRFAIIIAALALSACANSVTSTPDAAVPAEAPRTAVVKGEAGAQLPAYLSVANAATTGQETDGKAIFDRWCSTCHGANPMLAGTGALAARYEGELPAALEERTDLTPEVVEHFVRNGVSVMPFFRKTEVSDSELKALGEYLAKGGN